MNEVITLLQETAERTPAQAEALRIDHDLRVNKALIESGLLGMAHDLKEMRDRKLYTELGYETFEAYTEDEHGIKSRQAYKYIHAYEQLGEEVLHSSAKLGITKLDLLSSLDADEREKLLAEHTVEELDVKSTAEYKALLEKYELTVEQLTMFENAAPAEPTDAYPDIDGMVEARLEVERENIRQAAEAEARKSSAEAQQAKLDELKKKAKDAADKAKAAVDEKKAALAEAEAARKEKAAAEEAKRAAEAAAAQSLELSAKLKAEQDRTAAMEKQIKLSADPELTRFKFMFESWQAATQAMAAQFKKLSDEMRAKMLPAFGKVMEVNGL